MLYNARSREKTIMKVDLIEVEQEDVIVKRIMELKLRQYKISE